MKKYYIITYGCQMNKSDSERIASILEKNGYQSTSNESKTDLIVVNMCSVRQSAVDRVYGLFPKFKKLKTKNSKLKTILTGCILKEDKKKFTKNFDLILNIKDLPNWPKYLKLKNAKPLPWQLFGVNNVCYLKIQPKYKNNFSVFIPISNGCDNFCSYCVVPYVRGPLICRSYQEILEEAKNVIEKGFREIWFLGQNVNDYKSKEVNFAKLLKMVNDIPGLQPTHHPPAPRAPFWIRFTSPHPNDFSDELIETIAQCQKVTPYLNLPVQSGDNIILKRMNRLYTIEYYKNLVKKIRSAFKKYRQGLEKEIAISTDIIVGFPGETKKQFENTLRLFKKIKFDMAYIAKYSPRPGTAAAKLKNSISQREKERRYKILTEILKETAQDQNKEYVGKTVEVLIEEKRNNFLLGKTKTYKTVKIQLTDNSKQVTVKPGCFIKVKIKKALPWGLEGEI